MADVIASVEMTIQHQGKVETFSNAFRYRTDTLDDANLEAIADALVNHWKAVHSSFVTFKKVRIWDVGTPPNYMRLVKDYTGNGSNAASARIYAECAYFVYWPLPRKFGVFRTHSRRLSKWIHAGATTFGGDTAGTSAVTTPIAVGNAAALAGVAAPNANTNLIAPDGTLPTGPAQIAPYLEHRQFPRGRKESA